VLDLLFESNRKKLSEIFRNRTWLNILSLVRCYKIEQYFVVAYEFVVVVVAVVGVELEIDLIVVMLMMVKQSK
jgi:hypothetical protein